MNTSDDATTDCVQCAQCCMVSSSACVASFMLLSTMVSRSVRMCFCSRAHFVVAICRHILFVNFCIRRYSLCIKSPLIWSSGSVRKVWSSACHAMFTPAPVRRMRPVVSHNFADCWLLVTFRYHIRQLFRFLAVLKILFAEQVLLVFPHVLVVLGITHRACRL